jgi:hypothetical protein
MESLTCYLNVHTMLSNTGGMMLEKSVKATIEVADSKVTFEGPASFVEAQVEKYLADRSRKSQADNAVSIPDRPLDSALSERALVAQKRPHGHVETVAVLAFALTESGVPEFTEDDMKRAYIRAGVRPPKVVGQALRDAKNVADYLERGAKRGSYRLSNHGDRTVRFDLPRG